MKHSQLKQLIKEEIRSVLEQKSIYDDPIKTKAEERYKDHSSINISGIGGFMDRIKIIPKGDYTVVEGDMEGRYTTSRFNVVLLEPMKPFDLAVQLAQETGWISPWNYLEMRMGHESKKSPLTFPLAKTLFDLD